MKLNGKIDKWKHIHSSVSWVVLSFDIGLSSVQQSVTILTNADLLSIFLYPQDQTLEKFQSKYFFQNVLQKFVCKMSGPPFRPKCVVALSFGDITWCPWSWSLLIQVMAWCLTAPSHYLNQLWLIINGVLWYWQAVGNFTENALDIRH